MTSNLQDIKMFYGMLRENLYPKNGSWKEAPALKNYAQFVVICLVSSDVFGLLLALQKFAWSVIT
jgi:hypothetical protein